MHLVHHGYLPLPASRHPVFTRLNSYFTIYKGSSPVDRSGTLTLPTRMKSLFPLPKMREFSKSYQDVCEQRAIDILQQAAALDTGIYVFWSGGIDSTCALISLLKHCKERERLTIVMDERSILEYPLFYSQHIRKKLRCEPSNLFTEIFNRSNLVVNGEHNDQLFGSDIIGDAFSLFGMENVLGALQKELITSLFQHKLNDVWPSWTKNRCPTPREHALFFSDLFYRLIETATVPLKTNFDLLWWINFVVKWQTVYMRPLIFSKYPITTEYVKKYYHPFYNTEEFQLWSMNNLDKRIKNSWNTYKWPCKDVIYDFTWDEKYRDNKVKYGSLVHILIDRQNRGQYHKFLDEDFNFHEDFEWYQPQNDFV